MLEEIGTKPMKIFKPVQEISARGLDMENLPPIEMLVDKLLPVGLSMLSAPPKSYKSYTAIGLCIAICNGDDFLGYKCKKHACLYMDLESTRRRPRDRINQIMGKDAPKPDNFFIIVGADEPGRINDGLEEQIQHQLTKHPDVKLVIIDVFQMVRQPAKRTQSGYDRDYEDLKALKQIADKNNIGIMLIHHNRKMNDPADPFSNISGSTGTFGSLDAAWVISSDKRETEEKVLNVTGRDLEPLTLQIKFSNQAFKWELLGTVEDVARQRLVDQYLASPLRETIVKLVKQGGGKWEGSAKDIKGASKYLSWEIHETPQQIGVLMSKYEPLFYFEDKLRHEYDPVGTHGKRIHTFIDMTAEKKSTEENKQQKLPLEE